LTLCCRKSQDKQHENFNENQVSNLSSSSSLSSSILLSQSTEPRW
jgi:hypothetical protein